MVHQQNQNQGHRHQHDWQGEIHQLPSPFSGCSFLAHFLVTIRLGHAALQLCSSHANPNSWKAAIFGLLGSNTISQTDSGVSLALLYFNN